MARIAFRSGATVIVEGPATLELATPLAGRLMRGKLVADVPAEAHGFRVDTPLTSVVDLGTRFGVSVGPPGTTDVHVLAGRVEVTPGEQPPQQITAGHAVRAESVAGGIKIGSILFQPDLFVQSLHGGPRSLSAAADAQV